MKLASGCYASKLWKRRFADKNANTDKDTNSFCQQNPDKNADAIHYENCNAELYQDENSYVNV